MPEKSDKELATELTAAWPNANTQGNPNTPFSIKMTQDAFDAFFRSISSAGSK